MNKLWWVSAPVAAALMLAASSQPYFSLVRPWSWSQERAFEASAPANFDLPVANFDGARHAADVEVLGFQSVEDGHQIGLHAPDGFTIWAVLTQWGAPAESVLAGCRMWVTGSDGKEYQRTDAVFGSVVDDFSSRYGCTPPGEEGPTVSAPDIGTDEMQLDAGSPRPEQWRKVTPWALPDGVQPTRLHIGWDFPHYLTIELPAPAAFVDPEPPAGV
ncbi:hypothetical protein [Corynebacterium fournieri]|uniref:hypothetical protein n=1 Tax=Corynebacterium fournieri TaxID=1852390 RepID=UPI000A2F3119|nr:hypothetical protein [Corynebacterium fournieri]WJY96764.1 hypothetical protein CFOUR_01630 [Corynebacterium fournieri]